MKNVRRLFAVLLAVVMLVTVIPMTASAEDTSPKIKNIIVMIPDGAGFGQFDTADTLKRTGDNVAGARSTMTTDAIDGMTSEGLYLGNFLVGTSQTRSNSSEVTDSAAGGSAIATGNRINNGSIAQSPDMKPLVTVLEASKHAGKATGAITTSCWFDATPCDFTAHNVTRDNMTDLSMQMFSLGLDILLGGGLSPNMANAAPYYTVVKNAEELEAAVSSGKTKILSDFHHQENLDSSGEQDMDYDTSESDHPTLKQMMAAALDFFGNNVKDEDGFFLLFEGGLTDNGGHSSNAVWAASEYIAFDEAFAYAVNWAMKDGETLIVVVPDHDTGGLEIPLEKEAEIIEAIRSGVDPDDIIWNGKGGHTGQNVPICLYAPDGVREEFLEAVGLPTDGTPADVRSGKYYNGFVPNPDYEVRNCDITKGIIKVGGLDMEKWQKELFVEVTDLGKYNPITRVFSVASGALKISANNNFYTLKDGTKTTFDGVAVFCAQDSEMQQVGKFYVPASVAAKIREVRLENWVNPFKDVKEKNWYFDAVRFMNDRGLVNGKNSPDTFLPLDNMSRAEFVTILWRMQGSPEIEEEAKNAAFAKFDDVNGSKWFADSVAWAYSENIVNGLSETSFGANRQITREQITTLIDRFSDYMNVEKAEPGDMTGFADAGKVSSYAKDAMARAIGAGIIKGSAKDGGTYISPKANATRAEVATILMRYTTEFID